MLLREKETLAKYIYKLVLMENSSAKEKYYKYISSLKPIKMITML